jgi:pimeloyl-ACP methyl ester carboxylesterase
LLLGAIAIGLALGLAIDVLRVGGLEAWRAARGPAIVDSVAHPPYDARGRPVEIDGGNVYLDCRGEGTPTVVLEPGFGESASSWGSLFAGLAETTRTCAWDRPGLGRSEARPLHTGAETARILRDALAAAGEAGPYVVVGFSLGGVYARLFAEQAPVSAFLMIDTFEPDLWDPDDPTLDPDVRATIQRNMASTGAAIQSGESLDWDRTMAELAAAGPVDERTLILTVEPRTRLNDPDPVREAAILAAWRAGIERRYPKGEIVIVPGAGHQIHIERPDLTLARARELVLDVRGSTPGGS